MKKNNLDFKGAVCLFLDKHKANVKVKNGFLTSENSTIEAFNCTMKILDKRQEQSELRMKQQALVKKQAN
jgi:hypothetical protein